MNQQDLLPEEEAGSYGHPPPDYVLESTRRARRPDPDRKLPTFPDHITQPNPDQEISEKTP